MDRRDFLKGFLVSTAALSVGVDVGIGSIFSEPQNELIEDRLKHQAYQYPEYIFVMPRWYWEKYAEYFTAWCQTPLATVT